MDENIERRNHYLDLAGIENYTSQFGPGKAALHLRGRGREGMAGLPGQMSFTVPLGLGDGGAFIGQVKESSWRRPH